MTSKRRESPSGGRAPRTRRRFTPEFKLEAVRLASSGTRRPAEVARELGIRADMLRQWWRQAEARAGHPLGDVFPAMAS